MATWGDMAGNVSPEPTKVINAIERHEIEWVFAMAEIGIAANYLVVSVDEANARLQVIREELGL